jgi:hypothetical protein
MNTREIAEVLYCLDLAEVLNDAGKQPRPPPVRLRGTRLLASYSRVRLARYGATPSGTANLGRPRACYLPSGL